MIIGKEVIRYKEIDSTNEEARRLIRKGAGEGLVLVADLQTKGKGKPGSRWFSPKGNLYLSAIVRPYKNPKDLAPITLLGALASRSMLTKISGLPVAIKWPNDLRIHGRKVGGILTERLPSGSQQLLGYLVIGIGININVGRRSFPEDLRGRSTSLKIESRKSFSLDRCLRILLRELDREYLAYLSKV